MGWRSDTGFRAVEVPNDQDRALPREQRGSTTECGARRARLGRSWRLERRTLREREGQGRSRPGGEGPGRVSEDRQEPVGGKWHQGKREIGGGWTRGPAEGGGAGASVHRYRGEGRVFTWMQGGGCHQVTVLWRGPWSPISYLSCGIPASTPDQALTATALSPASCWDPWPWQGGRVWVGPAAEWPHLTAWLQGSPEPHL